MSHTVNAFYGAPTTIARIRDIPFDRPWRWLAAGWSDLRRAPAASLGYGAFFVIVSYLLVISLVMTGTYYLLLPMAAGFFLVAPFLGIGLYQISRSLEQGDTPSISQAFGAWFVHRFHVATMGAVLVVIFMAWIMLANLLFVFLFSGITPTWENFLPAIFSAQNIPLLLLGTGAGAMIAAFVFSIAAISIPMLLDRDIDVFSAIHTSMAAVRYNMAPMALWAVLIVLIVGAGMMTLFVGLVLGLPILGHATWHAYRDLVER
ncbi:MAG: DUF2189 domain-containing protein [Pseudomonadota bacterium]|nr:DUF2189 domain-containing protein [Pseudomonadota bacterium]